MLPNRERQRLLLRSAQRSGDTSQGTANFENLLIWCPPLFAWLFSAAVGVWRRAPRVVWRRAARGAFSWCAWEARYFAIGAGQGGFSELHCPIQLGPGNPKSGRALGRSGGPVEVRLMIRDLGQTCAAFSWVAAPPSGAPARACGYPAMCQAGKLSRFPGQPKDWFPQCEVGQDRPQRRFSFAGPQSPSTPVATMSYPIGPWKPVKRSGVGKKWGTCGSAPRVPGSRLTLHLVAVMAAVTVAQPRWL